MWVRASFRSRSVRSGAKVSPPNADASDRPGVIDAFSREQAAAARTARPRKNGETSLEGRIGGNLAFSRRRMGRVRMANVETLTDLALDRRRAIDWYRSNRRRSTGLFDLLSPDAYYDRPIALRNPIAFYEGHLPAFSVNTLVKKGLGEPGVDRDLEVLFERGIDPEDASAVPGTAPRGWPSRDEIRAYGPAARPLGGARLG